MRLWVPERKPQLSSAFIFALILPAINDQG